MYFGIFTCLFLPQSLNMIKQPQLTSLSNHQGVSQETFLRPDGSNLPEVADLFDQELVIDHSSPAKATPSRLRHLFADEDKTSVNTLNSLALGNHEPSCTCTCLSCVDDSSSCATSIAAEEKKETKRFRSFVSLASDDMSHDSEHVRQILEHNQQWVKETNERDPEYFIKLAQPQRPKYLYYGCSDSRVPANQILGLGPGEVFVHRNIGNQVMGNDLNALSVLEYGVMYIGVTDIIVTGHYDCGAVRAATKRQDLGTLEHWLRSIRDVYRLHRAELDDLETDEDKHFALVELNVIEQCLNLFKTGVVQRKRIQSRKALLDSGKLESELGDDVYPRIHGLVFNPADGVLKKLPIDFEKSIGSLDRIYGLYDGSFAL